jgi:hypothetical protein
LSVVLRGRGQRHPQQSAPKLVAVRRLRCLVLQGLDGARKECESIVQRLETKSGCQQEVGSQAGFQADDRTLAARLELLGSSCR